MEGCLSTFTLYQETHLYRAYFPSIYSYKVIIMKKKKKSVFKLISLTVSHIKVSKLYFYKYAHFFYFYFSPHFLFINSTLIRRFSTWFLSFPTPILHIPTLIPLPAFPILFPAFLPWFPVFPPLFHAFPPWFPAFLSFRSPISHSGFYR